MILCSKSQVKLIKLTISLWVVEQYLQKLGRCQPADILVSYISRISTGTITDYMRQGESDILPKDF